MHRLRRALVQHLGELPGIVHAYVDEADKVSKKADPPRTCWIVGVRLLWLPAQHDHQPRAGCRYVHVLFFDFLRQTFYFLMRRQTLQCAVGPENFNREPSLAWLSLRPLVCFVFFSTTSPGQNLFSSLNSAYPPLHSPTTQPNLVH